MFFMSCYNKSKFHSPQLEYVLQNCLKIMLAVFLIRDSFEKLNSEINHSKFI